VEFRKRKVFKLILDLKLDKKLLEEKEKVYAKKMRL